MQQSTYIKECANYKNAYEQMVSLNQKNKNPNYSYALVEGPDDNYAVVDLSTAIDLDIKYIVAHSSLFITPNPWEKVNVL